MPTATHIPLDRITTDPAVQPRVEGVDPDHVRVLQEAPHAWSPLVVVQREDHYLVVDGSHRLEAARQLGRTSVTCEVRPESDDCDLTALAFALNRDHGKPLTLADRKAEAERLLRHAADHSDRQIAALAGLSDKTVGKIRSELQRTADIPRSTSRVGADGKTRSVAATNTSKRPTSGTPEPGRRNGQSSGRSSVAMRRDPSFVALLDVLDRIQGYADDHAADGLAEAVAMAVYEHRSPATWSEIAAVMERWGEALTEGAQALRQRAAA